MGASRARRFIAALSAPIEACKAMHAAAYGAALGFQLHYVKSMTANPAKASASAMRHAATATVLVEDGLYSEAFARLGDDFLAAAEAHRRKRLILDNLLHAGPAGGRSATSPADHADPPASGGRSRAVTGRTVRALRNSVLGPTPTMLAARPGPHDYRRPWVPRDLRVEHQLLVALEEWAGRLPGLTEANLLPFVDPKTGLLLPWDDAAQLAGTAQIDRAVREYLLDFRCGEAVLAGAEMFTTARAGSS